jgi:hypothetical protein
MDLSFLNNYWTQDNVASNKHFNALNVHLHKEVNCNSIAEDKIKTMYRGSKQWDIHFPLKKVAIEYKTIATQQKSELFLKTNQTVKPYGNLRRNIGNRIEEAIGAAVDVKHYDNEYKLGYLMVFTLQKESNLLIPKKIIDKVINQFDKMIKNNLYNFFCPLITFGIDDHMELSESYTMQRFIEEIKSVETVETNSLEKFFIDT